MSALPTLDAFLESVYPGAEMRTVTIKGAVWFAAPDVGRNLGVERSTNFTQQLPKPWIKSLRVPVMHKDGHLRLSAMNFLSLQALVWITARSYKSKAAIRMAAAIAPLLVSIAKDQSRARTKTLSWLDKWQGEYKSLNAGRNRKR